MKKRLVFVDDEANILQGLQRILRPMRHEWEMHFAASAAEALSLLEGTPCDVIISDMRMPHMDGAQLLTCIRERYPHMVRIILSGYADNELLLRAVGPAHQYLSKPCDATLVQETVNRACMLHRLLSNTNLRQLVAGMQTIPSLPTLYSEVQRLLQAPNSSLEQVGKLIEQDLGMTVKLLQLVNSAFFGLRQSVTSPVQAVRLLGLNTVAGLILSSHLFASCDQRTTTRHSLETLWSHSMTTAVYARTLAQMGGGNTRLSEDAFMAGLLHDVGKLVFATQLSEQYMQVPVVAQEQHLAIWEAEQQVFGATHAEVGAYLLGLWGLPAAIVEALAFHHHPMACGHTTFSPVTAVHVANVLAHSAKAAATSTLPLDHAYLAGLGLADQLENWRSQCQRAIQTQS
ncbi:MAG: HDOD domain-containing protein [Candidatus Tectimicrobiota bacterium]